MFKLCAATHYYATQQARRDWAQLAEYAKANGYAEEAAFLAPAEDAGHKTIDKRIDKLMQVIGISEPFWKWQEAQASQLAWHALTGE